MEQSEYSLALGRKSAGSLAAMGEYRAYLDIFRERYCPELGRSIHYPKHDYPWKAPVSPEDLARAMARVVMSIDSEIFKPLAEHGGLSQRLGHRLHSCYTEMWSTQLHYGDGTSVFDAAWHYDPKTYKPNPANCARMGHWYPVTGKPCVDCGEYQARHTPIFEHIAAMARDTADHAAEALGTARPGPMPLIREAAQGVDRKQREVDST